MRLLPLIACAFLLSGCSGCGRGYSEGERTGVVVKFSNKGLIYKSWEGDINLGGTVSDGKGMVPRTWSFTVTDGSLVPKFQAALESGARVKVKYVQWVLGPVDRDSDYEVVGLTEASR